VQLWLSLAVVKKNNFLYTTEWSTLKNDSENEKKRSSIGFPPGVKFIIILHAAFTRADSKSVKIQLSCQYLFALLGSVSIKAGRKMLMKLTPMYVYCKLL